MRINIVRNRLDKLLKSNASFQQIYDLSVKLDLLIVIFYKRSNLQNEDKKQAV